MSEPTQTTQTTEPEKESSAKLRIAVLAVLAAGLVASRFIGGCHPSQVCFAGDYAECQCEDDSWGYAPCDEKADDYGACKCDGTPGLDVPGLGTASGTSTGGHVRDAR